MADEFTLTGVNAAPTGSGVITSVKGAVGKTGRVTGAEPAQKTSGGGDSVEISADAKKKIAELKQIDQDVRAHEGAHMAAGGGLVRGGATYSYQRGPDGKNYAVAGEVSLDTSPVPNNPAATIQKAEQIKAAALAPADPSPQDRKVAASAGAMEAKASAELAQKGSAAVKRPGANLNVFA